MSRSLGDCPPWALVSADDPREASGATHHDINVTWQWRGRVPSASHRAWTNAAKVIAHLAEQRPDARYVEGWATPGLLPATWHAWVDVPVDATERGWIRIDTTPSWGTLDSRNWYGPVLEVRASELLPFVSPLRGARGRALCRLPLVALDPRRPHAPPGRRPDHTFADEFGSIVVRRCDELLKFVTAMQAERQAYVAAAVQAHGDHLAALGVLPPGPKS